MYTGYEELRMCAQVDTCIIIYEWTHPISRVGFKTLVNSFISFYLLLVSMY